MSISVCMATYNGAPFVEEQLRSILAELGPEDEVIVVDDYSTDDTVAVIRRLGDRRIKVHVNETNRREVYSFGRALQLATGDVVFLSDQDDVWLPGRADAMVRALRKSSAAVVSSNFEWMDSEGRPIVIPVDGVRSDTSRAHLRNIVDIFVGRTNYYGCAMALRREFIPVVTPIPSWVESHDLWIALASNCARSNVHIDVRTLRKRQHGGNATSPVSTRSLYLKLRARVIFAASLVVVGWRLLTQSGRR